MVKAWGKDGRPGPGTFYLPEDSRREAPEATAHLVHLLVPFLLPSGTLRFLTPATLFWEHLLLSIPVQLQKIHLEAVLISRDFYQRDGTGM